MNNNLITSDKNPIIKSAAKLLQKKYRYEQNLFLCESEKAVFDVLSSDRVVTRTVFCDINKAEDYAYITDLAEQVYYIAENCMKKLSDLKTPPGIVSVCKIPKLRDIADIRGGRYVFLEKTSDSGNMGAIIRCANAMGIDGIIITPDCADVFSPRVIRASMASVLFTDIYLSDSLPDGFAAYATVIDEGAVDVREVNWADNAILCIGNESRGLSPELCEICEHKTTIKMTGDTQSLNAAAAAAIIIWEMQREHG